MYIFRIGNSARNIAGEQAGTAAAEAAELQNNRFDILELSHRFWVPGRDTGINDTLLFFKTYLWLLIVRALVTLSWSPLLAAPTALSSQCSSRRLFATYVQLRLTGKVNVSYGHRIASPSNSHPFPDSTTAIVQHIALSLSIDCCEHFRII